MGEQRDKMIKGESYRSHRELDPELAVDRLHAMREMARYNATEPEDDHLRHTILKGLLNHVGEGTVLLPHLRIEYGYNTTIGDYSYMNYDGIILDNGPVTIGSRVLMGPRVQLITALHPVDDYEARHAGWQRTKPITIEDGVWFGGGVIVLPGVTVGRNSVVGAGSVVARDIPDHVLAVGNPARVVRKLTDRDLSTAST